MISLFEQSLLKILYTTVCTQNDSNYGKKKLEEKYKFPIYSASKKIVSSIQTDCFDGMLTLNICGVNHF